MSTATFKEILPHLFGHEGGYADHPRDPGGATRYGITSATLSSWRGRTVTKTDVRRLTRDEAAAIYKARYWDAIRGDDLPAGVDYCVFDAAVNSGPARAAKWLQAAARVAQDGAIGPLTIAAACALDPAGLVDDLCDVRLAFLRGLSTWPVFGRGWERRVEEVRTIARRLAASGQTVTDPPRRTAVPVAGPATRPREEAGFLSRLAALVRMILTGGVR